MSCWVKRMLTTLPAVIVIGCLATTAVAEEMKPLFQIGIADNNTADLALGRKGFRKFDRDAIFLVGLSKASKDWPYVQPGPDDAWAGGRPHTFTILFALANAPQDRACRLVVDLIDTHGKNPPPMDFDVNGHAFHHPLPKGAGDASIMGKPAAGKEYRFTIDLPGRVLKQGTNELRITTAKGSWILYDWLSLEAPAAVKLAPPQTTLLRSVQVDKWLSRDKVKLLQPVTVTLAHFGPLAKLTLKTDCIEPIEITVEPGINTKQLTLPPVQVDTPLTVELCCNGQTIDTGSAMRTPAIERPLVDYVDCLLGTSTSRWMLYPGPSMPFGMVKLSPDNQQQCWKAGYEYTIGNIAGFSHLHSWTMGGLLTMPTTGELKVIPGTESDPDAGYRSRFRHDTEVASPGYYAVTLDDYQVRAELTATTRTGMQRYTFPKAEKSRILFDLLTPTEYGYSVLDAKITKVSDTQIEGYSKQRSGRNAPYQQFTLHFVARLNKSFASMGGWVEKEIQQDIHEISGKGDVGVFLNFTTKDGEVIELKTGISLVSIEQARLNLETETSKFGWDFDAVRNHARKVWGDLLRRVEVEGGTETQKVKFYTNFYRSYCSRTIWSDVNGKYVDMYEQVQQLDDPDQPVLGCDAFWNTFWNLNQLWALVTPDVTSMWVNSLLEIYGRGGWLAKGPTGIEYSSIMVASHEIALIVSAYQQGIRDFDVKKAYRAIKEIQTIPGRPHKGGGYVGNHQLKSYMELGYVPVEKGPVSNTLEYAYDDWCVAQMAKALDKQEDYHRFFDRAMNYKNVFDRSVGYMRQKRQNGSWVKNFSPFDGHGFVEGNSWQFTWFVPQDVAGLIGLLGKDEFNRRLNKGLEDSVDNGFNATGDRMADFPINHGNQPNMQAAWLFNYSGKPWLTQKWTREIMARYYGTGPIDGWPGDEDQGQMGAWYVMSAMGLFQLDGGCSVKPIYEIGSPIFDKITIHLDNKYYPGSRFVIETRNNSPQNVYIQSASLDGKPLNKPWLYHHQLVDGGRLALELGPVPNKQWGSVPKDAPPQN